MELFPVTIGTGKYLRFQTLLYQVRLIKVCSILLLPLLGTGQAYKIEEALVANNVGQTQEMLSVFVLDWKLCHVSSFVFDLGQMFAELYLLRHFRGLQSISTILSSFLAAYGWISADDCLNIMIHCGTHLIFRPWRVSGWGNEA